MIHSIYWLLLLGFQMNTKVDFLKIFFFPLIEQQPTYIASIKKKKIKKIEHLFFFDFKIVNFFFVHFKKNVASQLR